MKETKLDQRFTSGSEEELEEAIAIYGEKLLRYAVSILCSHQDAEDIVQRVFLSAYQSRSGFNGNNLSAWLYKITYNLCLNHLKKRRLFFFSDIRNVKEESANPDEENELSDEVLSALGKLKAEDRALIYGRIIDEHSYEELSQMLGKPPNTLRKRYERAKKKLASYLTTRKQTIMSAEQSEKSRKEQKQWI